MREYWAVDPARRLVELASRDEEDLKALGVYGIGAILESPVLPGFTLDVGRLFAGLEDTEHT